MGAIATRRERVLLDVESNAAATFTRDATAAALLKRELTSLSGTSVQTSRTLSRDTSISKMGKDSETSGKQIDRLSGRLALLAQAAAVLGPALVPLGAPLATVMAGMTAQLGAAAGALGVTILAFHGLGKAMKSVSKFQLEPTADNLQAMRIEMEKLGPAGADFVHFLGTIGPQLRDLQMAARDGIFPGMQEGIENLLPLLPQVQRIISDLSTSVGNLAADAGAGLAGPGFNAFFDYLDNEAGPILEQFGRTVGNFASGFANMVVGFAPLTDDFGAGLEDLSQRFQDWSMGLEQNDGFQQFVDYVQESGPKALDLLGAFVDAVASIVEAAAPVGDVVLPILTGLLKVVAQLADSPMGTAFLTAAAAMSVYSRAAAVAAKANLSLANSSLLTWNQTKMLGVGLAATALAFTDFDDKAGLSNTAMLGLAGTIAGPFGAAAGVGIGVYKDLSAANDDLKSAIEGVSDAFHKSAPEQRAAIAALRAEIQDTRNGNFLDKFTAWYTNEIPRARNEIDLLRGAMGTGNGTAVLFGETISQTGDQLAVAAGSAEHFSGALAELNGWLDKRQALRDYRASVEEFTGALKNGFQPKNFEGLDQLAGNIAKVASQIKDKSIRADFLADARAQLADLAKNAGPKGQAAIQRVIDKLDELGLTHPKPKLDVDDKPAKHKTEDAKRGLDLFGMMHPEATLDADDGPVKGKVRNVFADLYKMNGYTADPNITADAGGAFSIIDSVRRALDNLNGHTATTYVRTVNTGGMGPQAADGTTVPKTGLPYADRHLYWLADGEEVVSNRYGQADRNRSLLKRINAGMLANGGTAGLSTYARTSPETAAANNAAAALDKVADKAKKWAIAAEWVSGGMVAELKVRQKLLEHEVDREKQRLDMLKQERQALADSIAARFSDTPFGQQNGSMPTLADTSGMTPEERAQGLATYNQQLAAYQQANSPTAILQQQLADAREMRNLLQQLQRMGLSGPALAQVATTASLDEMRALLASGGAGINQYEQLLGQVGQISSQIGSSVGNAVYGQDIKEQTKELRESKEQLRHLNQRIENLEKSNKAGHSGTKAAVDHLAGRIGNSARSR